MSVEIANSQSPIAISQSQIAEGKKSESELLLDVLAARPGGRPPAADCLRYLVGDEDT